MSIRPNQRIPKIAITEIGHKTEGFERVQLFLGNFGYLDSDSFEPGHLDEPTSTALASYQRFNSLEVTGSFDAETREAMAQPRCALPDVSPVAFKTRCSWPRWQLTFSWGKGTDDESSEFRSVARALRTWQEAMPLTFSNTFADMAYWRWDNFRFDWVPGNDGPLGPDVLGYAGFPPGCTPFSLSFPQPVRFNDEHYNWDRNPSSHEADIETVALHEIGHVLGLEHSSVPTAVMFPRIPLGEENRFLDSDDRAGLHALYPHEDQWRCCRKCQGLFYGPSQAASRCAAGGGHDGANSGNYVLSVNSVPSSEWVGGWRRCGKCQGLYFAAGANSRCPAGQGHAPIAGGTNYSTYFGRVLGAAQQEYWAGCFNCEGLYFNAFQANSRCPAGGGHIVGVSRGYFSLSVRWVPDGPTIYVDP